MSNAVSAWLSAEEPGVPPGKPQYSSRTDESGNRRKRVALLIEDNPADVLLVREAIDFYALPVDLHVMEDGQKGLDFIRRTEDDPRAPCPEIILLDLNLPGRSGKEVLEHVRRSGTCKDIPVLIISSSDVVRERDELARLGATRYFRKPSSYDAFLQVGRILKELLEEETIN